MNNEAQIERGKAHRLNLLKARRDIESQLRMVEIQLGHLITGIEIGDTISYAHGRSPVRRRAKVVGFELG